MTLALPLQYTQAHTAPVRRVTYLRHPHADAHGNVHLDWEQPFVVSVGGNGRVVLTDLRDAAGSAGGGATSPCISLSRGVGLASASASIQDGCIYFGDIDSEVQKMRIRTTYYTANTRAAQHVGQVWVRTMSCAAKNLALTDASYVSVFVFCRMSRTRIFTRPSPPVRPMARLPAPRPCGGPPRTSGPGSASWSPSTGSTTTRAPEHSE
jgi:hypothetical protein